MRRQWRRRVVAQSVGRQMDGLMARWVDGERGGRCIWRTAMRKRREMGREFRTGVGRADVDFAERVATPRVA